MIHSTRTFTYSEHNHDYVGYTCTCGLACWGAEAGSDFVVDWAAGHRTAAAAGLYCPRANRVAPALKDAAFLIVDGGLSYLTGAIEKADRLTPTQAREHATRLLAQFELEALHRLENYLGTRAYYDPNHRGLREITGELWTHVVDGRARLGVPPVDREWTSGAARVAIDVYLTERLQADYQRGHHMAPWALATLFLDYLAQATTAEHLTYLPDLIDKHVDYDTTASILRTKLTRYASVPVIAHNLSASAAARIDKASELLEVCHFAHASMDPATPDLASVTYL